MKLSLYWKFLCCLTESSAETYKYKLFLSCCFHVYLFLTIVSHQASFYLSCSLKQQFYDQKNTEINIYIFSCFSSTFSYENNVCESIQKSISGSFPFPHKFCLHLKTIWKGVGLNEMLGSSAIIIINEVRCADISVHSSSRQWRRHYNFKKHDSNFSFRKKCCSLILRFLRRGGNVVEMCWNRIWDSSDRNRKEIEKELQLQLSI